jgi:hypothetical protein
MDRVHHFGSSNEAYDASLDEAVVRQGDILVIAAERIVGLASTDPIAITAAAGALKQLGRMGRETLLREVAHTEADIGRAVDEALRHHFSIAEQYLGFAGSGPRLPQSEVSLTLSRDEIMVTDDAIRRQVEGLRKRLETIGRERSEGLFLAQTIERLTKAQDRLASALKPNR